MMHGHKERKARFDAMMGKAPGPTFEQRAAKRLGLQFNGTDDYCSREEHRVIEEICQWMMQRGYATGPGDTIEDLLVELEWQARDGGATGT